MRIIWHADPIPPCPRCTIGPIVRNGPNPSGTPTYRGRGCRRRFVARPKTGPVPDDTRELVLRLLGERPSLRAVARTAQVSRTWPRGFVNALYRNEGRWAVEPPPERPRKSRDLVIEADELWSFVGSKMQVAWVWAALDADTRRVVVGDRSDFTAQCLWDPLPAEYPEHAVFCTDFLPSESSRIQS